MDDWKVALVEEWVFGGTCLNRGCIPTKMFVHTADTVLHVQHSARLGVDAHVDGVRWADIRNRVFGRIDPIAAGGEKYRTYDCPNVTVHAGRGRFIGERQIEVATMKKMRKELEPTPEAAFGASPSRGQRQRPGKAGSAAFA